MLKIIGIYDVLTHTFMIGRFHKVVPLWMRSKTFSKGLQLGIFLNAGLGSVSRIHLSDQTKVFVTSPMVQCEPFRMSSLAVHMLLYP